MLNPGRAAAAALGCTLLIAAGCRRAVPPQQAIEDPAHVAMLRESLRDVFMAQEIYYSNPANNYAYTAVASQLDRYTPRPGTTLTIFEGTKKGWSAMVQGASGHACVMYVGQVSAPPKTPRGVAATRPSKGTDLDIACDP